MNRKKLLVGSGVLVMLLSGVLLETLYSAGVFRTIEPHYTGICTRVDGVVGAEDITIDPVSGIAYISAMDRRTLAATGEHLGGIYTYVPGTFETPVELTHDYQGNFHPHGIDLWQDKSTGNDRLFVINHPPAVDTDDTGPRQTSQIDIFDVTLAGLQHVRSVKPNEPVSLNDITAAGADSFYASIDQGSTTPLGRTLEVYGRLARAGVLYGKGEATRKEVGGLVYANGVQLNSDGSRLYVAETTGKRLSTYAVDPRFGALAPITELDLDSGLDNIEIADDGTLWIVSHPKTFDFLAHAGDAKKRSPSQIFTVKTDGDQLVAREIYLNDGDPISGASVAAPYKDRFLIGSVFEPFILDCSIPSD